MRGRLPIIATGAWLLALAVRLWDLDATMMLADSVGPYLSASANALNPHAHAPPYGWGLHPPFALALLAPNLRMAVAVMMGFHALAAPLATLCAARVGDWRHGLVAGAIVALEPGLLDTALSGAEGYLAPVWLGLVMLLVLTGRGAAAGAPAAWAMAVMNHPLSLCAAPLLGLMPRTRRSLVGLAIGAGLLLSRGWFEGGPNVEGVGIDQAALAWLIEGPWSAGVLILALLTAAWRRRSLALVVGLSVVLLIGAGALLGYLRDHHLRLFVVPLAACLGAVPGWWVMAGLLVLRPPMGRSPEPGKPHRPGTLGLTTEIAASTTEPVMFDGAWLSGPKAAEASAVNLDRSMRGLEPDPATVLLIVSFERGQGPPGVSPGARHALLPPDDAFCAGRTGGAEDAMHLFPEGTTHGEVVAWRDSCEPDQETEPTR